ncbi:SDR family NAD(P)-dependent oxidoreductase [Pacificimonas pallii]|uniref:SDR family NAD(P)-dependent oxidoreductase n=1 Tax=Pacificimonas pallii TaxID=2827236 RepID=UPI0034E204A2
MSSAVIIGASGGIGRALTEDIIARGRHDVVHALSRSGISIAGAESDHIDIEDENSIAAAAKRIGKAETIIVATGLLHADDYGPEKNRRALNHDDLMRAFAANAVGPALVAKHFLPLLPKDARGVFAALSARVGSISDNRLGGWYGYRASKAALNQLIRTLAIELARQKQDAVCVALHPGTVDTGLSKPFQSNVADGKLFTPRYAAGKLLSVLDGLTAADTGKIFAWDGQEIAP